MDYDKLIERLRSAAGGPEGIQMCQDAATAIETLRADLARVTAERDAAIEDLRQMCVGGNTCAFCRQSREDCKRMGPGRKTVEPCWEWRGIKED